MKRCKPWWGTCCRMWMLGLFTAVVLPAQQGESRILAGLRKNMWWDHSEGEIHDDDKLLSQTIDWGYCFSFTPTGEKIRRKLGVDPAGAIAIGLMLHPNPAAMRTQSWDDYFFGEEKPFEQTVVASLVPFVDLAQGRLPLVPYFDHPRNFRSYIRVCDSQSFRWAYWRPHYYSTLMLTPDGDRDLVPGHEVSPAWESWQVERFLQDELADDLKQVAQSKVILGGSLPIAYTERPHSLKDFIKKVWNKKIETALAETLPQVGAACYLDLKLAGTWRRAGLLRRTVPYKRADCNKPVAPPMSDVRVAKPIDFPEQSSGPRLSLKKYKVRAADDSTRRIFEKIGWERLAELLEFKRGESCRLTSRSGDDFPESFTIQCREGKQYLRMGMKGFEGEISVRVGRKPFPMMPPPFDLRVTQLEKLRFPIRILSRTRFDYYSPELSPHTPRYDSRLETRHNVGLPFLVEVGAAIRFLDSKDAPSDFCDDVVPINLDALLANVGGGFRPWSVDVRCRRLVKWPGRWGNPAKEGLEWCAGVDFPREGEWAYLRCSRESQQPQVAKLSWGPAWEKISLSSGAAIEDLSSKFVPRWPFAQGSFVERPAGGVVDSNATQGCGEPRYYLDEYEYSWAGNIKSLPVHGSAQFPSLDEIKWPKSWALPEELAVSVAQNPPVAVDYKAQYPFEFDPLHYPKSIDLRDPAHLDGLRRKYSLDLETAGALPNETDISISLALFDTEEACRKNSPFSYLNLFNRPSLREQVFDPCVYARLVDSTTSQPLTKTCVQAMPSEDGQLVVKFEPEDCPGKRRLLIVSQGAEIGRVGGSSIKQGLIDILEEAQAQAIPFEIVSIGSQHEPRHLASCKNLNIATVSDALFRNIDGLTFQSGGMKPLADLTLVLERYRRRNTELDSVLYLVDSKTMPEYADDITITQKAGVRELKDKGVEFYVLTPQEESCPLWQDAMTASLCQGLSRDPEVFMAQLRLFLGLGS